MILSPVKTLVEVVGSTSNILKIRALLNLGSQMSFIALDATNKLWYPHVYNSESSRGQNKPNLASNFELIVEAYHNYLEWTRKLQPDLKI